MPTTSTRADAVDEAATVGSVGKVGKPDKTQRSQKTEKTPRSNGESREPLVRDNDEKRTSAKRPRHIAANIVLQFALALTYLGVFVWAVVNLILFMYSASGWGPYAEKT